MKAKKKPLKTDDNNELLPLFHLLDMKFYPEICK